HSLLADTRPTQEKQSSVIDEKAKNSRDNFHPLISDFNWEAGDSHVQLTDQYKDGRYSVNEIDVELHRKLTTTVLRNNKVRRDFDGDRLVGFGGRKSTTLLPRNESGKISPSREKARNSARSSSSMKKRRRLRHNFPKKSQVGQSPRMISARAL